MYDINYIKKRIKEARKDAGLTQEKLAEQVPCKRETVTQWESGKNIPPLDALIRLCDILQCDITFLLGEHPEKRRETSDACKVIGLTEAAVEKLKRIHEFNPEYADVISVLITNANFEYILYLMEKRFQYAPKPGDVKPIIEKQGTTFHLKNAQQYENYLREREIKLKLDEGIVTANKSNLLDSLIVSAISNQINEMAKEYDSIQTREV